jgi:hypothetical protein
VSTRYVGIGTRNIDNRYEGNRAVEGTFTYYPQDFKMLGFALGSVIDTGASDPYTHTLEEANSDDAYVGTSGADLPFASFTVVDSKNSGTAGNNFIRTVKGCMVDTFSMSASQGEVVECEVGYKGKEVDFSSGAKGAITAATTRPFIYSDVQLAAPSGTVLNELKEVEFSVNNNINVPFYLNGSRITTTPIPENRDYELSATLDMTSTNGQSLYEQYFKGGSEFNAILSLTAASGTRECYLYMSGCRITEMEIPSPAEGVNEYSMTIVPKSCNAVAKDAIAKYNAW